MVHNYIEGINNYSKTAYPLAFFSYIAGGFGTNINTQLAKIIAATGVHGSAVTVSHIIQMVENLPDLDTEGSLVDPSNTMELRKDEVQPSFPRNEMLQNAPYTAAGCILIPKVVD